MTADTATLSPPCLCGCGQLPNKGRRWLKGHAARGAGGYRGEPAADVGNPFTAPGARLISPDEAAEMTDAQWDQPAAAGGALYAEPGGPPAGERVAVEDMPPGEYDSWDSAYADEPPAHGQRAWSADVPSAPIKVTAAVRRDIRAKIGIPLAIGGALWEARDPMCGGRFQEQRSAITGSLADIVCDSPQLVAFFMSTAGGFMKYLELAFACWPVAEMVLSHHVLHRIPEGPPADATVFGPAQNDPARYPA